LRSFPGLALILLLGGIPAAGVTLPGAVGDFRASEREQVHPATLERLAGDDSALLRECGVREAERATYTSAGGRFTVRLYRMRDATSSYAAYTVLRTEDMAASDLAEKSAVSRERVLAVVGNLLVDIAEPGAASVANLKNLLASVSLQAEITPFPILWQSLPAQGLVPNSARYLLGPIALQRAFTVSNAAPTQDWVGFSAGAEAQAARYRLRGQSISLLLAVYPTPQAAQQKLEEWKRIFVINPEAGKTATVDPPDSRPVLFVERRGALLAAVAGSPSATLAKGLLAQVEYERELMWNEPGWRATERPFIELLLMVFVGSGVIIIYLIVSSLAFGIFRLAIKRLLPGKIFDRPGEMEILQLGLHSKPIEAKDFYTDSRDT
jgi:hypothetical protein